MTTKIPRLHKTASRGEIVVALDKRLSAATKPSERLDYFLGQLKPNSQTPPASIPAYTKDLRATLGLLRALLPGWEYERHELGVVISGNEGLHAVAIGTKKVPALNLCLAIVRALISKGGKGG